MICVRNVTSIKVSSRKKHHHFCFAGPSMELMSQRLEHREMLYKLLHCRYHQSHQLSGGVLGVRYWLLSFCFNSSRACIPDTHTREPPLLHAFPPCVYNSPIVARSDLQAQHAWNDRWLGKTRPDSSATGNNTGHRLGPCVLLYLERGCLDREGKTFAKCRYPIHLMQYCNPQNVRIIYV